MRKILLKKSSITSEDLFADFYLLTMNSNLIKIIKRLYPDTIIGILLSSNVPQYKAIDYDTGSDLANGCEDIVEELISEINMCIKQQTNTNSCVRNYAG